MNKKAIITILLICVAATWQTLLAQQVREEPDSCLVHKNDTILTSEDLAKDSILAAEAEKRRDSLIMLHSQIIDRQVTTFSPP